MEIFPKVQFIVTTHAPSVIHSIKEEHLIVLEDYQAFSAPTTTYGRDVNSILSFIMGAEKRPKAIQEKFDDFYDKLYAGKLNEADDLLSVLENEIGTDDPELTGAKVSLDLEKLEV
jgi:predicted ATP-binding protein involved in virulence